MSDVSSSAIVVELSWYEAQGRYGAHNQNTSITAHHEMIELGPHFPKFSGWTVRTVPGLPTRPKDLE